MENYNYIFVLGYDLLHDFLSNKQCECDVAFEFCKIVYHQFLESEFNDKTQAEYDCLQNYINSLSYGELAELYCEKTGTPKITEKKDFSVNTPIGKLKIMLLCPKEFVLTFTVILRIMLIASLFAAMIYPLILCL